MKKFLIALNIVIWSIVCVQLAHAEGETKKVCVDVMKDGKPVKDAKGNPKQSCKEVKKHQKHDATAVPDGKKK